MTVRTGVVEATKIKQQQQLETDPPWNWWWGRQAHSRYRRVLQTSLSGWTQTNTGRSMDLEEVKAWIIPPDYDHSEAEAKHLVFEADIDHDGGRITLGMDRTRYIVIYA